MRSREDRHVSVQITIRNVPDEVRDELADRAARRHQSMQEFLLAELERLAAKPSIDEWLERVRRRKSAGGLEVGAEEILGHRDAGAREL